jgi:hypothetical protein
MRHLRRYVCDRQPQLGPKTGRRGTQRSAAASTAM